MPYIIILSLSLYFKNKQALIMEKYLSIYLTTPASRSLISANGIVGINMATTQTVKIWYKEGKTITLTLSAVMAANDNSIANFLFNEIAKTQEESYVGTITYIPTPLPKPDGAGNSPTITSMTIA